MNLRILAPSLVTILTGVCLFLLLAEAAHAKAPLLRDSELTLEGLKNRIDHQDIKTPDDLVGQLPASMMSRYGLAFESRSPHKLFVSPSDPRIVLVNEDGMFALAISTVPDEQGKVFVDFRDVDRSTFTLKPHMIEFDMVGGRPPLVVEDPIRYYEHDRQKRCDQCHGVDHHDIWDDYKSWPGFFGQIHHQFGNDEMVFSANAERLAQSPIYRHLPDLTNASTLLSDYNSQMTQIFGQLNAFRIGKRIIQNPSFPKYRAAILAALMNDDLTSYLSEEDQKIYATRIGPLTEYVHSRTDKYFKLKSDRLIRLEHPLNPKNMKNFNLENVQEWANLKFICERMGLSTENWWMTFERETFSGMTPMFGLKWDLFKAMADYFRASDKDIMPKESPTTRIFSQPENPWVTAARALRDRVRQEGSLMKPNACIPLLTPDQFSSVQP